MKNTIKILSLAIVFGLAVTACGDESFDIQDGGSLGAIMAPVGNITYLAGISTGVSVALNPFINDGVTVTGINVTKQLFTTGGDSEPVTYSVSGDTFVQSVSELYADVPVTGTVQDN